MKGHRIDIEEGILVTQGDTGESRGDKHKDQHFYGEDFPLRGAHPSIFFEGRLLRDPNKAILHKLPNHLLINDGLLKRRMD